MNKTIGFAAVAVSACMAFASMTSPVLSAGDTPPSSPYPTDSGDSKSKSKKKSDNKFIEGYRTAYASIYHAHDYAKGIAQLKALGRDNRADVANLIGYANRKLGKYDESKVWYEAALKADPTHVRTWQYYGLWQLEQGNRTQAQLHLDKIAGLCGTSCAEYRSLAEAMGTAAAGGRLVY